MAFNLPFDLEYFLVTTFAGSYTLFMAIAFLVIAAMCAMFRMPNSLTLISFALFIMLLAVYFQAVFALIIIIGAFVMFYILSRLFR